MQLFVVIWFQNWSDLERPSMVRLQLLLIYLAVQSLPLRDCIFLHHAVLFLDLSSTLRYFSVFPIGVQCMVRDHMWSCRCNAVKYFHMTSKRKKRKRSKAHSCTVNEVNPVSNKNNVHLENIANCCQMIENLIKEIISSLCVWKS